MKLIYVHENRMLVVNAKNLLSLEGIDSVLKNEFSAGGTGELAPISTWPELWITDDRDYDKAKSIIDRLFEKNRQEQWQCHNCKEINDPSFDFCWNCQSERF